MDIVTGLFYMGSGFASTFVLYMATTKPAGSEQMMIHNGIAGPKAVMMTAAAQIMLALWTFVDACVAASK
jgi:hypothetical protein